MTLERIDPDGLARPSGFSHAVVAFGPATTVYLSGQTATDGDGTIVGRDVVEQFRRALANLLVALAAAGARPADLASLTIYVVDVDDYRRHSPRIGQVWRELVGADYPAMAAVGVTRLWDPEALVEMQGVAVIPAPSVAEI